MFSRYFLDIYDHYLKQQTVESFHHYPLYSGQLRFPVDGELLLCNLLIFLYLFQISNHIKMLPSSEAKYRAVLPYLSLIFTSAWNYFQLNISKIFPKYFLTLTLFSNTFLVALTSPFIAMFIRQVWL